MKIVKEKSTHRAVFLFADDDMVTLGSLGMYGPDVMVSDVSSDSHEIVNGNGPELPLYWVAGALSFNGAWAVQDQVVYDAFVGQAKVMHEKAIADRYAKAVAECRRQRAAEYPPMADYLDGIVKGDQTQVQAYIDACLAVKVKYPKP